MKQTQKHLNKHTIGFNEWKKVTKMWKMETKLNNPIIYFQNFRLQNSLTIISVFKKVFLKEK